jgi:hypothetical protein
MGQCHEHYFYDQINITDLDKRSLSGKVESVLYSEYDPINNFGEISKGSKTCEQLLVFNRDGNLYKIINYDLNGDTGMTEIHEYENGFIKSISNYQPNGSLF